MSTAPPRIRVALPGRAQTVRAAMIAMRTAAELLEEGAAHDGICGRLANDFPGPVVQAHGVLNKERKAACPEHSKRLQQACSCLVLKCLLVVVKVQGRCVWPAVWLLWWLH